MRAHRGDAGRGQQRPGGPRPAGVPGARGLPLGRSARPNCSGLRPALRALPAQQRGRNLALQPRGAGRRPARAAEGGAPLCAARRRPSCSRCRGVHGARRTAAGCAWATCRPTSTPTPPASCWCRCWRQHDRQAFEVFALSTGPRRRQRAAPARGRRGRTLRGTARPRPGADRAARARSGHRHPGRPEGRHLRHAAAGAGRASRRRCR